MGADNTPPKAGLSPRWQPGQSGNPQGRPKGSRNRLSEEFLAALQSDFAQHGVEAIAKVRAERPHEYLKIVASLLPRQVEIRPDVFDGVSNEFLEAIIDAAKLTLAASDAGKPN